MTYSPINAQAYTSAFSGALAGMAVGGWITSDSGSVYADVCNVAGAFAQAFDIAWDDAAALDMLSALSITTVCEQDFSMRGPGPAGSAQFQNPNSWTRAARACATLVLRGELYFADQSITPPPFGSGGGGTLAPLTETFWMDVNSTHHAGVAADNGTTGAFSTFAQVIATAVANATLLLAATDFSAEGAVDFAAAGFSSISFNGLSPETPLNLAPILPPITGNTLGFSGVQCGSGGDPTEHVVTAGDGVEIFANYTNFQGKVGSVGALGISAYRCLFAGPFFGTSISVVQLTQCVFLNTITTQPITGWSVDIPTLQSLLQNVPFNDVTTPILFTPLGTTGVMRDADTTLNAAAWDFDAIGISAFGGGFTASRTLTVDLTHIPVTGTFKVFVENGDLSVNTLTVTDGANPTVINSSGSFIYTFQNVAAALTLVSIEQAPFYPSWF